MSNFRPVEDGIFIGPQPTPQDLEDARQLLLALSKAKKPGWSAE